MAALDLPINDTYLSHLHQVRNARKAKEIARATSPPSTFSTFPALEQVSKMSSTTATSNAVAQGSISSLDIKASDTAILSQYPSSLVRLLVLLSPLISLSTRFVRLATWTAGPGTASHSFLLLLSWWAVCLYGYEILRYAPQAVLLSIISYNGLARAFQGVNRTSSAKSRTVSSDSLNATIDDLSVLADFFSTLSSSLLEPVGSLLSWNSFEETKALTIFLVTTWPLWLLCFGRQLWDVLGLPRFGLQARRHALQLLAFVSPTVGKQAHKGVDWARQRWPAGMEKQAQLQGHLEKSILVLQTHLAPLLQRLASSLASLSSSPSLRLTLFPPFPLFSLSVRHLFLVLGTIVLTWCSPWCALIRHALWRSALVRQSTRRTIALFSGQSQKSLYLRPESPTLAQSSSTQIFDKDPFSGEDLSHAAVSSQTRDGSKDLTRHEDVVYQFTVFENQRWWMGLDWTAALLPQERPSWADESNNPVSPPSSFSLPPAKTTLKPAPTSSSPKAYVKRLVRWQWIDAEWTVAGREGAGELNAAQKKGRRDSSTSSATATSGTLFSNSTTGAGGSPTMDPVSVDDSRRMSSSSGITNPTSGGAGELPADLQWLDVDAEGWQYGDNGWEKMSRKGGLGRYTRRRRWIRRAVLVEVVQKNYLPSQEELTQGSDGETKEKGKSSAASNTSTEQLAPSSPTLPSSPRAGGGDLKQRLARAAAQNPSLDSKS